MQAELLILGPDGARPGFLQRRCPAVVPSVSVSGEGWDLGSITVAPRPISPMTARTTMAIPYDRPASARPATKMVPAIAVPIDDPRLDTLRDSPEISPWRFSGKADCTTLTDGVSIRPTPRPIRNSPGAK